MGLFSDIFGTNQNSSPPPHRYQPQHNASPPTPHKDPKYQNSPSRPAQRPLYISVRWGRNEPVDLPLASVQQYRQCTVHDIKLHCKALFHIPLATMTLKYNNGFLRDDQATLESLGILPGSELVVLGDQVLEEQAQQLASGNEEEVGQITRIRQIMKDPLAINLDNATEESLAVASEIIMRALLALDGIECAHSFTTARQERRQAVQFCQSLLDRVDALKYQQQQQKL